MDWAGNSRLAVVGITMAVVFVTFVVSVVLAHLLSWPNEISSWNVRFLL